MTAKKKPANGITLRGDGGDDVAIVAAQKAWAYEVAAGIEGGKLPDARFERRMIAAIIRHAADQLHAETPARGRGNPSFARKLPDDDTVAVMVGMRIGHGAEVADAIAHVADSFEVHVSTVSKIFQARRSAVADFFADTSADNLQHRVGAIRGE